MNATRLLLLLLVTALIPAAVADDGFVYETALLRHDAGTYYVRGRLNDGPETEFLVDTGSSYVALTRKTFRSLKRSTDTVHLRDIEGTMAAGRSMRVAIYRLDALAIGDRCVLRNVEVAVMPGATRNILGLSALRQMQPLSLSLDPPRLRFARCMAGGGNTTVASRTQ